MIRSESIMSLEEWESKRAVLTLKHPTKGVVSENILIIQISPPFLLCRDSQERDQVYVLSDNVIGWEVVDEKSLQVIEDEKKASESYVSSPQPRLNSDGEPTVIRKVHRSPGAKVRPDGIIEVDDGD